jgi:putative NADPH-quinone reductase
MDRIERNDATVMIFPVWWWSMPALMKSWVDRVWSNGCAYCAIEGAAYPPQILVRARELGREF